MTDVTTQRAIEQLQRAIKLAEKAKDTATVVKLKQQLWTLLDQAWENRDKPTSRTPPLADPIPESVKE